MKNLAPVLAIVLTTVGCTEILVSPTDTQVTVETVTGANSPNPAPVTPETPDVGPTRLRFEDGNTGNEVRAITIPIGTPVTVKVVAFDESGRELPDSAFATIRDESVARVKEHDHRHVTFSGLTVGATVATIRAGELSGPLPIAVVNP